MFVIVHVCLCTRFKCSVRPSQPSRVKEGLVVFVIVIVHVRKCVGMCVSLCMCVHVHECTLTRIQESLIITDTRQVKHS